MVRWSPPRGAAPAAAITDGLTAVFIPDLGPGCYDRLAPLYADTDLVLVEGDANGPGANIEVWRAERGEPPLASERQDIAALVTDDPSPVIGCAVL